MPVVTDRTLTIEPDDVPALLALCVELRDHYLDAAARDRDMGYTADAEAWQADAAAITGMMLAAESAPCSVVAPELLAGELVDAVARADLDAEDPDERAVTIGRARVWLRLAAQLAPDIAASDLGPVFADEPAIEVDSQERESILRVLTVLCHESRAGLPSDAMWQAWSCELRITLREAGHEIPEGCGHRRPVPVTDYAADDAGSVRRVLAVVEQECGTDTPMVPVWEGWADDLREIARV